MRKQPYLWIAVAVIVAGVVGLILGAPLADGWQVLTHYPPQMLVEEAHTMAECAGCHEETDEFHTCDTCHDDHGSVEMENVPFYGVVAFVGDVPEPGYVLLDDILPYRDRPHTYALLLDVLEAQGINNFISVTLTSPDGGSVTLARDQIGADAWLMPFTDGIRFAAESQHASAWIKGIQRIIVVGAETPLNIEEQATSMGRLLQGVTQSVNVEQATVMLKNDKDGQIHKANVASRIEGIPLANFLTTPNYTQVIVRTADGAEHILEHEVARTALLAQINGKTTVVLPQRGRSQWITEIVTIQSEK
ncbi:MAG: hypothetical protein JXA21_28655 [Anaerolineae bacterium]|nr:hypothetical protein [Anaerolineae bacterium]